MMRKSTKKAEPKFEIPVVTFVTNRVKVDDGATTIAHHEAYIDDNRTERVGRATTKGGDFYDGWIGRAGERTVGGDDDYTFEQWQDEVEAWVAANAVAIDKVEDLLATPQPPRYFVLNGKLFHQTSCSGYSGDAFFKDDTLYFEWSAPYVEGVPHTKEDTAAVVLRAEGWTLRPVHAGYGSGGQVRDEYDAQQQAAGEAE